MTCQMLAVFYLSPLKPFVAVFACGVFDLAEMRTMSQGAIHKINQSKKQTNSI